MKKTETKTEEGQHLNKTIAENAFKSILKSLGEDPDREGLIETPKRYVKAMEEFLHPPEFNLTMFDAEGTNQMIVQTNIRYYSFCEHHVLPFFGYATIGYLPNERIVGLSKLARTLDSFARRLQNQERITAQVAEFLMEKLDAKGVGVALSGTHFCMSLRGVSKPEALTYTYKLLGAFQEDENLKKEFMSHVNRNEK